MRVALVEAGRSVGYGALHERVSALARVLLARGVGAGSLVGVHVERSVAYVTCVLAILELDATVMPLPPAYPAERLRELAAFAALDAVLDAAATPLVAGIDAPTHRFEALEREVGVAHARRPTAPGASDRAAFVLASSGSTGTPKLIVRSHASFFHRLEWTWATHPYRDGEACCQKSHMTTTHAIYELFEPLLQGVPVHLISDAEVRDLEAFWETIRARGITRLLIVPSVLQASLELAGFAAPPLTQLVLMGEPVHPRLAAAVLARFPEPTRIHSIYGSTEASSAFDCDLRVHFRAGEQLPLGVPLVPAIRAAVLDDALAPVPVGEVGMLHISGPPLFTEYHRAPALTAAAFVTPATAPDADADAARLFRTRDSVRRMPDGSLRFVGRVDNTVKIRGFRVDLEEVERAILLQPDVRQCAVVVRERGPGTDSLAAFVSPASVASTDVLRRLRERLPAHMVPSLVTAMAALPRTPSGKVDRRALAGAREDAAPASTAAVAPGRATWQRVAAIWGEVLDRRDVERDSVFFDIGGTSLTVFAVLHRLRSAFGLDRRQLSDQSLYRHASVDALADHIDALVAGTAASATDASGAPTVLVTLKKGADPTLPPVFLVPSAGGTLGAYERLLKVLTTRRAVIGLRDPFLWGERDPTIGFQRWVAVFVDAIRARQPKGPYYIVGYSSAGAFALEIAQHLRRAGEEVALLALIDTLALDRASKWRFGYWALEARFYRPIVGPVVRAIGSLRRLVPRVLRASGRVGRDMNIVPTRDRFESLAEELRRSADHLRSLAALLELNTGLPFSLTAEDVAATAPERYLALLLGRVRQVAPDVDTEMIANIVIQYRLQVRSQHEYRLQRYDGPVALFEVHGPYFGMVAVQLRPYVRRLTLHGASLGEPTARTREISEVLTGPIRPHFQCMRDEAFVAKLAEQLQRLL